jgi:hypothetical protein
MPQQITTADEKEHEKHYESGLQKMPGGQAHLIVRLSCLRQSILQPKREPERYRKREQTKKEDHEWMTKSPDAMKCSNADRSKTHRVADAKVN